MIRVRRATTKDMTQIAELNRYVQQVHADAYPWLFKAADAGSFTVENATGQLAKEGFIAFVAHDDDEPTGYVIAEERRRPETDRHHARNMMYIHEISVRDQSRRKGVGRALIEAVGDYGRSVGIELLALETWEFNKSAQAFFKSCGLSPFRLMMWNRMD